MISRPSLIALLTFGLLLPSLAQEQARVGKVLDIDGRRLYSNKLQAGKWFQAYPGMPSFLTERLRTDAQTQAILEFAIGGRAGLGRGTEVEIVSQNEVKAVGDKLVVKSGALWAKIDKQKSKLQIQTAGGVIGIEGTELLVNHDLETKFSEVLLFEGKVSLYDENEKLLKTMAPGDYASFGEGSSGLCVLSYPPTSLRTLVVERFPRFSSFLSQYDIATIPKPASPTLIRGFLAHRASLAQLLEASQGASASGDVSGLSPSQQSVGGKPSFRWDPVPGASSYQVVLASDEGMEDIAFSGQTDKAELVIPDGAPGLEAGKYFFRVIPLDDKGEPVGKASQTWFESQGWDSAGVAVQEG